VSVKPDGRDFSFFSFFFAVFCILCALGGITVTIGYVTMTVVQAKSGAPFAQNFAISEQMAKEYAEGLGYKITGPVEAFYIDPVKDLGCRPNDHSGFKLSVQVDELRAPAGELRLCCVSDTDGYIECHQIVEIK